MLGTGNRFVRAHAAFERPQEHQSQGGAEWVICDALREAHDHPNLDTAKGNYLYPYSTDVSSTASDTLISRRNDRFCDSARL